MVPWTVRQTFTVFAVIALFASSFSLAVAEEEGSTTKTNNGSDTRGSTTKSDGQGSDSKQGELSTAPSDSKNKPKVKRYKRLPPTQVAPDLAPQVLTSAVEIDRLVLSKLQAEKIRPNPLTNDMQFVRRVYLDITGTIPTARQASAFLSKSRKSNKRAALIDELLNSQNHVGHSFNYWADILRLRDMPTNNNYGLPYAEWIKDVLAHDLPYDEFVYRMLSAEGRVWENPAAGYTLRDLGMPLPHLDNTVRVFLGTRIGCAQCHDHPFDRWTQKEFYQLAAFLHGTRTNANRHEVNQVVADARAELASLTLPKKERGLPGQINQFISLSQRSLGENRKRKIKLPHDYQYDDAKPGQVMQPAVLFGEQPKLGRKDSRRQAFAKWVTSPENPRFTLTIANRLWKRAFGVGVIEPVDDLTDDSEPSNPELMDFLVSELKRVNYSQREFLRILYNTKTYQREAYRKDLVADQPYHFPGPTLRRMTAEQLWDSLLTLTLADPNRYQRPRSDRMVEIISINPGQKLSLAELRDRLNQRNNENRNGQEAKLKKQNTHKGVLLVKASELPMPMYPAHFLRQFGQSDRLLISGGNTEGHVPQILTMFNGPISHKLLNEGTVIYDEVIAGEKLRDQIDVIFLSLLSRKPSRTDRNLAAAEIKAYGPAGFGNVIWALLNTREFLFIQ